ncbi:MAG: GatB/YqeY domain-containing protein [Alphaproteobacteria bacterium]|nr:GatB/YqeY domain-containing protein [Alphaproteobacteria bacterium]
MLREDIQNAIKEAMKNHETVKLSTARMILAGIKEKDVDARGKGKECAAEADLMSMMQTMIKQRQESAKMYREANRPELAEKEEGEIVIIQGFLPKQMSEAEVDTAINNIIAELNATSMKDMGAVMAKLRETYAGQMDFGAASGKIKAALNK